MELTIKRIVTVLVLLSSVVGAMLTFALTFPTNDTAIAIAAALATSLGIIAAAIRLLEEIDKEVETGVTNYKNGVGNE